MGPEGWTGRGGQIVSNKLLVDLFPLFPLIVFVLSFLEINGNELLSLSSYAFCFKERDGSRPNSLLTESPPYGSLRLNSKSRSVISMSKKSRVLLRAQLQGGEHETINISKQGQANGEVLV